MAKQGKAVPSKAHKEMPDLTETLKKVKADLDVLRTEVCYLHERVAEQAKEIEFLKEKQFKNIHIK
jgi:hypothetical protein